MSLEGNLKSGRRGWPQTCFLEPASPELLESFPSGKYTHSREVWYTAGQYSPSEQVSACERCLPHAAWPQLA